MKASLILLALVLIAAPLYAGNGDLIVNGNLGVGTTSPTKALTVVGNDGNGWAAVIENSNGVVALGTYGGGPCIGAFTAALAVTNLLVNPIGGNVGIGTTSPSYTLQVNGTAYAAGAAGALSDERHKDNIQALDINALGLVSTLRPVTFVWKEPKDIGMEGQQIGFIAQEVEKVIPQLVLTEPNEEKTKGIKYTELIPILTKAIQEQQAQIEVLQAQVAALQAAR